MTSPLKLELVRLLFVILTIISIGCKPLKNLSPKTFSIEPISKSEFPKLNGRYLNLQDTVFGKIEHFPLGGTEVNNKNLLDRLFMFYPGKENYPWASVELNFTSDTNALVTAHQNGTLLVEKYIRGRYKKGYFYVRPKIFIIPFFPVFYWQNFQRVRIGKMGNNLVVDHTINSWGFALFAGGSESGRSTSIYIAE